MLIFLFHVNLILHASVSFMQHGSLMLLKIYFVLDIILENQQSLSTMTGLWLNSITFLEWED